MKKCLISLLSLLLLTACAKAPDEVKTENSILDNAEVNQTAEAGLEYLTLDEIRARAESDISESNTNVVVKSIRIGGGSSMPVYDTVRDYPDYKERIGKAVSEIYNDDLSSDMKGTITTFDDDDLGAVFYSPEGKTIDSGVSATSGGSMGITYEFSEQYGMPAANGQESIVKSYFFAENEQVPDDVYIMTDGKELSVGDAAKEAERLFNTYFLLDENSGVSYKTVRLDVYKYPDGKHGFLYYMDTYDKDGNILIGNLNPVIDVKAFDRKETFYPFQRVAYGYFTDSQMHPYAYTNITPSEGEIKEPGDKLLSLKSAMDILSGRLASSAAYELDAALAYIAVIPPADGLVEEDDHGEKTIFGAEEYFLNTENNMELRPFWVFRDSTKSNPEYSVWGGLFTIDALTGELYIF